jgi:myo-inositol-1(or 4)-monophosphatase
MSSPLYPADELDHALAFVSSLLDQASAVALQSWGKVKATVKPGDRNQVLTATDLEVGHLLTQRIGSAFPAHNILDEELGAIDHGSDWTWVTDPIDGTSNFAEGLPHFGIQVALLRNDQPVLGGIALPAFGQIALASLGRGAKLDGVNMHASTETDLSNVLVAYGIDGHPEEPEVTHVEVAALGRLILAVRNLRSSNSAYDAVATADGRYGAWINRTTKIWDQAAHEIVLSEAGCLYTDLNGVALDYQDALSRGGENFEQLAAPPALHGKLLEILARPSV